VVRRDVVRRDAAAFRRLPTLAVATPHEPRVTSAALEAALDVRTRRVRVASAQAPSMIAVSPWSPQSGAVCPQPAALQCAAPRTRRSQSRTRRRRRSPCRQSRGSRAHRRLPDHRRLSCRTA
jgi:hypothetical protein